MDKYTTVFLSSTAKDLQPYQDAVAEAVSRLERFRCVRMDPYAIITWVPPEGGGGPNYSKM